MQSNGNNDDLPKRKINTAHTDDDDDDGYWIMIKFEYPFNFWWSIMIIQHTHNMQLSIIVDLFLSDDKRW